MEQLYYIILVAKWVITQSSQIHGIPLPKLKRTIIQKNNKKIFSVIIKCCTSGQTCYALE